MHPLDNITSLIAYNTYFATTTALHQGVYLSISGSNKILPPTSLYQVIVRVPTGGGEFNVIQGLTTHVRQALYLAVRRQSNKGQFFEKKI